MKKGIGPVWTALGVVLACVFLAVSIPGAESGLPSQPVACADVTLLAGSPVLLGPDSTRRALAVGQRVYAGSILQTDSASRLELTFPDGDIVRMAEETTIELGAVAPGVEEPGLRFQVVLTGGEVWVNLAARLQATGFQLLAAGGMFSGKESAFRAALFPEGDVEVKTYSGEVIADGPFEIVKIDGRYTLRSFSGGEDETVEPWRHQMEPYWKMIVLASGAATPPFRFAAKSDLTDWVRWNRQRDGER
jgi:hypothetical protein